MTLLLLALLNLHGFGVNRPTKVTLVDVEVTVILTVDSARAKLTAT
jgi:hypothetical protein